MPNAKRTWVWTILRIKHKVPFFHNKCPIFDKNGRNLFLHLIGLPDGPHESIKKVLVHLSNSIGQKIYLLV